MPMCNLYRTRQSLDEIARLFRAELLEEVRQANVASEVYPGTPGPVLFVENGVRELKVMSWGFPLTRRSKRTGKPLKPKPKAKERSRTKGEKNADGLGAEAAADQSPRAHLLTVHQDSLSSSTTSVRCDRAKTIYTHKTCSALQSAQGRARELNIMKFVNLIQIYNVNSKTGSEISCFC